MSDKVVIKPDGSWEFQGEDSRMRNPSFGEKVNYRVPNPLTGKSEYRVMHRVFCMNCGADGGLSAREASFVMFLCDDCYNSGTDWSKKFCPMLPDEEYAWRQGIDLSK